MFLLNAFWQIVKFSFLNIAISGDGEISIFFFLNRWLILGSTSNEEMNNTEYPTNDTQQDPGGVDGKGDDQVFHNLKVKKLFCLKQSKQS